MLKASRLLPSISLYSYLRLPMIDTICKYGSYQDAEQLYPHFLQTKQEDLLPVIITFGDAAMADDLYRQAISNGKLKEEFPAQTLLALSYLGHQPVFDVIMDYYKNVFELDWTLHEAVCQSLLNYNCTGYEVLIEQQVKKCLDLTFYPDYVVLPAAIINNNDLLLQLIQHAKKDASPSCTGPLILAIALSGQQNRPLFLSSLLEEEWAVHPFEDNSRFITMGMHALSIPLKEIYATACAALENNQQNAEHLLQLVIQLMEAKLKEPVQYFIRSLHKQSETFQSVYEAVFISVYDAGFLLNNPGKEDTIYGYLKRYAAGKDFEKPLVQSFERLEELYLNKTIREAENKYRLPEE